MICKRAQKWARCAACSPACNILPRRYHRAVISTRSHTPKATLFFERARSSREASLGINGCGNHRGISTEPQIEIAAAAHESEGDGSAANLHHDARGGEFCEGSRTHPVVVGVWATVVGVLHVTSHSEVNMGGPKSNHLLKNQILQGTK